MGTERTGVGLPERVQRAAALAEERSFPVLPEGRPIGYDGPPAACIPEVGKLLATLVASRPGDRFAEHGTGIGIGTAWTASAMSADSTPRILGAEIRTTPTEAALVIARLR